MFFCLSADLYYLCKKRRTIFMSSLTIILIIRPQSHWGITSAELKRVDALGQYMNVLGAIRSEWMSEDDHSELRQLSSLCEEMESSYLFTRYANRKIYKRENDFWASDDKSLQKYIKQMADKRLIKAINLANGLHIPILYAANSKNALHITNQLIFSPDTTVTSVMSFHRHEEGTEYRLKLRVGGHIIEPLSTHHISVLTYQPGVFILDNRIYFMEKDLSGQLLLPFLNKPTVSIPRRMENDYFRRFILKNVAKVEIEAEGFDIEDLFETPIPQLSTETSIDGQHILSLRFRYGLNEFSPDSLLPGRVTLQETEDSFRFTRQLRNRHQEQLLINQLRQTGAEVTASGIIRFTTLSAMVTWLRTYGPQLRHDGFDVVQPSDHVYYIGPLSVEQNDTWHGDWLQTDVTIVIDEGRLRIPFRDLRDTILRGEQEFMLPSGERLLIPSEWLARYSDLLLIGMPKNNGFQRHRSQVSIPGNSTLELAGENSPKKLVSIPTQKEWKGLRKLKAKLRPYQMSGFEWLWKNFDARTGCCLSDEMGLGKTIQTIALLLEYKETAKTA